MHIVVNSQIFRFALRFYFIVVLLAIGILGDRCCHLRAKLNVLRGRQVSLTAMTGWLRGTTPFRVLIQFRRFPGGLMGLFMMAAAILAILSDLAVTSLVHSAQIPSFCFMKRGIILDYKASYPAPNGAAYQWANSAQAISVYNGGLSGIYLSADNSTNFYATATDLAGWWDCQATENSISYDGDQTVVSIYEDLLSSDLIYDLGTDYETIWPNGTTQLVIVSASTAGLEDKTKWDFKAAVDLYDSADGSKEMQTYQCVVVGDETGMISEILANIDVNHTLTQFAATFQGSMYDGMDATTSFDDPAYILAWILNSMTMVSGTDQSVSQITTRHHGCLIAGTNVPPEVILLFFVVTFMAIFMFVYTPILWLNVRRAARQYDTSNNNLSISSKEVQKNIPNGLVDWMRHAVHETDEAATKPEAHHLWKWLLRPANHRGRRMSIVNKHGSLTLSQQGIPSTQTQYQGFQSAPFFGPGYKGYANVAETEMT